MLLKTYQKIISSFKEFHGYMSFADLLERGITILQIQELEQEGSVQKFSRGWYWCRECGFEKPDDYKYIEIAKVNPRAVMCMDSACYLNGILREEPSVIAVATERTDRKRMELDFPIRRYYFQNTGIQGEVCKVSTEFGDYRYYSSERSFCDCFRMKDKLREESYAEILKQYQTGKTRKDRLMDYAKALRAVRNVEAIGRR